MKSDVGAMAQAMLVAFVESKRPNDFGELTEFFEHMAQAALDAVAAQLTRVDVITTITPRPTVSMGSHREHWADSWEISIQDEGRTLKLFAKGAGAQGVRLRDESLAELIKDNPYIHSEEHHGD